MRRSAGGMVSAALLTLGCAATPGMGGVLPGGGGGGGTLTGGCGGDFGATAAANKLEAFLMSTDRFVTAANEVSTSLRDTCLRIGQSLGIPAAEMQPTGEQTDTEAACHRVATELRSIMADARAAAGVTVALEMVPPQCEVSMDAYASCAAQCQADIQPGELEARCEGGEIRGTCTGNCTGRCAVEVSGQCGGACEGTCTGSCTGVCRGTCDGQCSARGPDGQCNGTCRGTCTGTCSAGCTGTCTGTCEVSGQAQCSGECRGGCSVAYTEPRCTGRVVPPRVDADCRAACDARVNAQARCTPARAHLRVTGNLSGDLAARVERARTAIESNYEQILTLRARVERLASSASEFVSSLREVSGAVGELGVRAGTCAVAAVTGAARAAASVQVSVRVSIEVSGSVSAGAR